MDQNEIKVEVFWVVTPSSVGLGHQCFRGPCCFHLKSESSPPCKSQISQKSLVFKQYHETNNPGKWFMV